MNITMEEVWASLLRAFPDEHIQHGRLQYVERALEVSTRSDTDVLFSPYTLVGICRYLMKDIPQEWKTVDNRHQVVDVFAYVLKAFIAKRDSDYTFGKSATGTPMDVLDTLQDLSKRYRATIVDTMLSNGMQAAITGTPGNLTPFEWELLSKSVESQLAMGHPFARLLDVSDQPGWARDKSIAVSIIRFFALTHPSKSTFDAHADAVRTWEHLPIIINRYFPAALPTPLYATKFARLVPPELSHPVQEDLSNSTPHLNTEEHRRQADDAMARLQGTVAFAYDPTTADKVRAQIDDCFKEAGVPLAWRPQILMPLQRSWLPPDWARFAEDSSYARRQMSGVDDLLWSELTTPVPPPRQSHVADRGPEFRDVTEPPPGPGAPDDRSSGQVATHAGAPAEVAPAMSTVETVSLTDGLAYPDGTPVIITAAQLWASLRRGFPPEHVAEGRLGPVEQFLGVSQQGDSDIRKYLPQFRRLFGALMERSVLPPDGSSVENHHHLVDAAAFVLRTAIVNRGSVYTFQGATWNTSGEVDRMLASSLVDFTLQARVKMRFDQMHAAITGAPGNLTPYESQLLHAAVGSWLGTDRAVASLHDVQGQIGWPAEQRDLVALVCFLELAKPGKITSHPSARAAMTWEPRFALANRFLAAALPVNAGERMIFVPKLGLPPQVTYTASGRLPPSNPKLNTEEHRRQADDAMIRFIAKVGAKNPQTLVAEVRKRIDACFMEAAVPLAWRPQILMRLEGVMKEGDWQSFANNPSYARQQMSGIADGQWGR